MYITYLNRDVYKNGSGADLSANNLVKQIHEIHPKKY